jgi:hypothetical protein
MQMTTPRRSKYIDQAVEAALRDVAILEAALTAYEYAVRTARNRTWGGLPQEFQPDDSLRAYLWRKRSEAQSRALMFGGLSTNPELKKRAWRAATDFIIRENSMIMGYLYTDNQPPSRWLVDVQTDFREEIHAAVKEKLGIDPDADLNQMWAGSQAESKLEQPSTD